MMGTDPKAAGQGTSQGPCVEVVPQAQPHGSLPPKFCPGHCQATWPLWVADVALAQSRSSATSSNKPELSENALWLPGGTGYVTPSLWPHGWRTQTLRPRPTGTELWSRFCPAKAQRAARGPHA